MVIGAACAAYKGHTTAAAEAKSAATKLATADLASNGALGPPILLAQTAAQKLVYDLTGVGRDLAAGTNAAVTNAYNTSIQLGSTTTNANHYLGVCNSTMQDTSLAITGCLQLLAVGGCVVGATNTCGYATDLASLSAGSEVGRVWLVASEGAAVGTAMATVMAAYVAAIYSLGKMMNNTANGSLGAGVQSVRTL